jgi:ferritin
LLMSRLKEIKGLIEGKGLYGAWLNNQDVEWLISEVEQSNSDNKELAELNQFLDNRIHEQHEEYKQLQQKVERLERINLIATHLMSDKQLKKLAELAGKQALETEGKE